MHYLEEPDPQEDDLVGKVLCGKWRVRHRIGRGGMSTVYAASHRNGRTVAVKVLRRSLAGNRRIVARFLREGYVANKIRHPGAVAILDDDVETDGTVFLVMELLDGATLTERYAGADAPPLGEIVRIGEQLLDVLIAAHESGVVHRDIKPSNVFLTRDGAVMLLDFGIARLLESETESGATHSGATLGTPGFMAPEQARGRGNLVDARTDIWALGALLFFLLTGKTVHEAETPNELLIASATQPARSVAEFCCGLPEPFVALVDRALEMDRDRRWPDARAMRVALEQARNETSEDVLACGVERALGMGGVSTLPETHTAEPAVVPRKVTPTATSRAHAPSAARRRRAAAWVIPVAALSTAGALWLRPSASSSRTADLRDGTAAHTTAPTPEPVTAATAGGAPAVHAPAPDTPRIDAPATVAPATVAPPRDAVPMRPSSDTFRGTRGAVQASFGAEQTATTPLDPAATPRPRKNPSRPGRPQPASGASTPAPDTDRASAPVPIPRASAPVDVLDLRR